MIRHVCNSLSLLTQVLETPKISVFPASHKKASDYVSILALLHTIIAGIREKAPTNHARRHTTSDVSS